MFTDIFGKKRLKINLHMHTSLSDGRLSPEDAAQMYKEHGYDAVAFTDHWLEGEGGTVSGLTVYPGVEYNIGDEPVGGVYHIVGLFMKDHTDLKPDATPNEIVKTIHEHGGLAILAHPYWSMMSEEQVMSVLDADATEIYNSVSDAGMSYRPESSYVLDRVALRGRKYRLLATDDVHNYDKDAVKSYICVEGDDPSPEKVKQAILDGRFYASQGPEIHARVEGEKIIVDTTPVSRIIFNNSTCWHYGAVAEGDGITHAEMDYEPGMAFVRVTCEDKDGNRAWTGYLF